MKGAPRLLEQAAEPILRPVDTFRTVLGREFTLAYRRPADFLNPLFFFLVVTSLFPVAISPLKETLM